MELELPDNQNKEELAENGTGQGIGDTSGQNKSPSTDMEGQQDSEIP